MALIAQTFAPFKSKVGRYETAVIYQVLNQIGAPAVKRVVADNNSRTYPVRNRFYDVEPWEPYFYSTRLGLSPRKITLTDPSLRMVSFKNIRFDDNNEPYANINKIGVPAIKRVVADNANRILPHKNIKFDDNNEPYANINKIGVPIVKRVVADNNSRIYPIKNRTLHTIPYVLYNYFYEIVKSGTSTVPVPAGTTGIDGTSQRATKHKNIPYYTISYVLYNYYYDIVKTGLYVKPAVDSGTTGIDGTSQRTVNVNDCTNFSISNGPYPELVQEGIQLYKITYDGDQSSVKFNNIRYDQSVGYIYSDPPYQIGLPRPIGTEVANDSRSIPITITKFHNRTLEGPYYVMTKIGLQMGNITGVIVGNVNYQYWS